MKLTRHERRSLMSGANLSDGHARQDIGPYLTVVERLPDIFTDADEAQVRDVEERVEDAWRVLAR